MSMRERSPMEESSPVGGPLPISRRRILGGAGVVAALAVMGGGVSTVAQSPDPIEAAAATPGPKRQWAMVIDLKKCEGCAGVWVTFGFIVFQALGIRRAAGEQ
jgi:hypothetical protein